MDRGRALAFKCIALAMSASACSLKPDRDCTPHSDDYCADGIAHECTGYDTPEGEGTRWKTFSCGAPDLCQIDSKWGVFCSLEPQPNPVCPPGRGIDTCEGNSVANCRDGFVVERWRCDSCTGQGVCQDEVDCSQGQSCASYLECRDGDCLAVCSCPGGEICPACEAYGTVAGSDWFCEQGACDLRAR